MDHSTILHPEASGIEIRPISECQLRVGAVSYLNTKPLIFGLGGLAPCLRIEIAPPSILATRLRGGLLDVALVPVMEYFSSPDYRLVAESAICGSGKVRSVLLFSCRPIEEARSICLDPESMTSNALLKALCREHFNVEPRWVARPPGRKPTDLLKSGECDAALVIGNNALAMTEQFPHHYDLGQEWWRLTGLPFVFAVWAARPGVETAELGAALRESLRLGLENLEWIAGDASRTLGLDRDLCLTYIRQMLQYELNDRTWAGMIRFYEVTRAMGLITNAPPPDLSARIGAGGA